MSTYNLIFLLINTMIFIIFAKRNHIKMSKINISIIIFYNISTKHLYGQDTINNPFLKWIFLRTMFVI